MNHSRLLRAKVAFMAAAAAGLGIASPAGATHASYVQLGHPNTTPPGEQTQVSCSGTASCFVGFNATSAPSGAIPSGLRGTHADSGRGSGVVGTTLSNDPNSWGLIASASDGIGVQGQTSGAGPGVFGVHGAETGTLPGILGQTNSLSSNASAVRGLVRAGAGAGSSGVWGIHRETGQFGIGVRGLHEGGGNGVFGSAANSVVDAAGVLGQILGTGSGGVGVHGHHNGSGWGVYGNAAGAGGVGVVGNQPAGGGFAGFFFGDVHATGTLSAGAKAFKIDHPLDPQNKYLVHAAVEAPELQTTYSGNVVTNGAGAATVRLPRYFQRLNHDFRYQLTMIGQRADAWVAREIANNRFMIRTSKPRVKVSWQVTAVRKDAFARANPLRVEETKPAGERGSYLNPELYGEPRAQRILQRPPAAPRIPRGKAGEFAPLSVVRP